MKTNDADNPVEDIAPAEDANPPAEEITPAEEANPRAEDIAPAEKDPQPAGRASWWTAERIRAIGWSIAIIATAVLGGRRLL